MLLKFIVMQEALKCHVEMETCSDLKIEMNR